MAITIDAGNFYITDEPFGNIGGDSLNTDYTIVRIDQQKIDDNLNKKVIEFNIQVSPERSTTDPPQSNIGDTKDVKNVISVQGELISDEISSGSTTSTTSNKLINSSATFTSGLEVNVNDIVHNRTTGATTYVTAVDSATQLSLNDDIFTFTISGAISNIDGTSSTITVDTSSAHGLAVNDYVTIAGTTNYNGTFIVNTTPTTTQFTISSTAHNFSAETTGTITEPYRGYTIGRPALTKKADLYYLAGYGGTAESSLMSGRNKKDGQVTAIWGLSSQHNQQKIKGFIVKTAITETTSIQSDGLAPETFPHKFSVQVQISVAKSISEL